MIQVRVHGGCGQDSTPPLHELVAPGVVAGMLALQAGPLVEWREFCQPRAIKGHM